MTFGSSQANEMDIPGIVRVEKSSKSSFIRLRDDKHACGNDNASEENMTLARNDGSPFFHSHCVMMIVANGANICQPNGALCEMR